MNRMALPAARKAPCFLFRLSFFSDIHEFRASFLHILHFQKQLFHGKGLQILAGRKDSAAEAFDGFQVLLFPLQDDEMPAQTVFQGEAAGPEPLDFLQRNNLSHNTVASVYKRLQ